MAVHVWSDNRTLANPFSKKCATCNAVIQVGADGGVSSYTGKGHQQLCSQK